MGSTVDPSLFIQDYSAVDRANASKMSQTSNLINALAGAGQVFAGIQQQQKDQKNALKSSAAQIQAASTLFPEMKPMLEGYSAQLNNEEIPISERAAIASQISNVINLGVDQMRYNTDLGFKKQDQQNQNQESAMRQWAFGQEVSAVERQQNAQQLDTKTKATIGPALLQQVIAMAPKGIADQVKAQAGDYSPDEQYQLAASVMSLIPKAERKKAPATIDVAVPGGSQKMQWDEARADWVPIQTAISLGNPTLADPNSKPLADGLSPKFTEPWKAFQSAFPKTEIKSGYRSPDHNAKVGGAKGSQHTHGNAIDIDVSSLDEKQREQALGFWASQGAKGFGYYNGNSIHVDFRDNPATWGPNYSKSSLPSTPEFFQRFSENLLSGKYQQAKSQPIGFTPDKSQEASVSDQIAIDKRNEEIQAKEQTKTAEDAAKARVLRTIDKYVDANGKPTDALNDAVGFGEGFGTWLGKTTGGYMGNEPETQAKQKELKLQIIEQSVLEAAKSLKPVSNDELKVIMSNRPEITDPPEVWASYMKTLKETVGNPANYIGGPMRPDEAAKNTAGRINSLKGGQ